MSEIRVKYPRTKHLPWSPGVGPDDLSLSDVNRFIGRRVIVTEKMDGENTTLYRDGLHARSISSRHHPSRDWIKSFHGSIAFDIPEGYRICGENLFAQHSIRYENLPSYFLLFSVWENFICLDWDSTVEFAKRLGLHTVPVLHDGEFDIEWFNSFRLNPSTQEGYVVRLAASFEYKDFDSSVAKWVRKDHVQTDEHWMNKKVVPNLMNKGSL